MLSVNPQARAIAAFALAFALVTGNLGQLAATPVALLDGLFGVTPKTSHVLANLVLALLGVLVLALAAIGS
ncbi:MAG: hypothetical protein J7518_10595 [Nocardioidaceae bacterium]|nr:hypothetical protein [Nocardioidaceae bacterium]